jgi:hypothetical protein
MLRLASTFLFFLVLWNITASAQSAATASTKPVEANAGGLSVARDVGTNPTARPKRRNFNWTGALGETALFLGVEHSLNIKNYLDIPHDHFFHRYAESVRGYHFDRWNDGNHIFTNDVGHPFSGAIVGYVFVQNSPTARNPQSAGDYWRSRLKATAWAAAYSLQWEIGPVSESSLGNYGIYPFLDSKGHVVNSTGLTDLVLTPVGGLGWMLAEDWLDHRFLSAPDRHPHTLLCIGLNPARTTANSLRLKKPCYRDAE